ncbi:MAG: hypothetical protein Q8O19_07395 [Rectinemataceae bacterium]|nr:hypothetical protein [Rectinemataceae bacterium]
MITLCEEDILEIRKPNVWDLGNHILYDMCTTYPKHCCDEEIIAKIWLIGRSYAASIERRKVAKKGSDKFYETEVAPALRNIMIDEWLDSISDTDDPGSARTVEMHKKLLDIFESITDLGKRSLASKYLHFHKPKAFFIYDSRARRTIPMFVPRINELPEMTVEIYDQEYRDFVRRCIWLREMIKKTFQTECTPREIDKLLLMYASRPEKLYPIPSTSGSPSH